MISDRANALFHATFGLGSDFILTIDGGSYQISPEANLALAELLVAGLIERQPSGNSLPMSVDFKLTD